MEKIDISSIKTDLDNILNKYNTYKTFTGSDDSYAYAEKLNEIVTICPYCNIEDIETVRKSDNEKGQRMCLDHFRRQNGTRERDLNSENIIPSCHRCNSNYKHRQDLEDEILNPLTDNFDELAQFSFDITPSTLDDYKNAKILINTVTKEALLSRKTANTISVFNLEKRYNSDNTKKDLQDFFKNMSYYPKIRVKDIQSLSSMEEDVIEYLQDVNDAEINKTKYGKFKKDTIKRYLI